MNICCLLLVANYVGRVLYANNVGQLLYVVFAPPAKCQHHGQTAPPRKIDCYECQISSDSIYFVFSFAVGKNSKHRNGISTTRLFILIFIVICYFWRFICFVWFILALCPALKGGGTPPAPGVVVVVMRCHKAHLLFVLNPFFSRRKRK